MSFYEKCHLINVWYSSGFIPREQAFPDFSAPLAEGQTFSCEMAKTRGE